MDLQSIYRITVFVPNGSLRHVVDGVKRVHPLGDDYYDSVLWYVTAANEEFRPRSGSNPVRGRIGELHNEAVSMLVFSIPRDRALLDKVLADGIRASHPWEAPGVFIEKSWTLEQGKSASTSRG